MVIPLSDLEDATDKEGDNYTMIIYNHPSGAEISIRRVLSLLVVLLEALAVTKTSNRQNL